MNPNKMSGTQLRGFSKPNRGFCEEDDTQDGGKQFHTTSRDLRFVGFYNLPARLMRLGYRHRMR